MFSRDFHNWCYFLVYADYSGCNYNRMMKVIHNHLQLVIECEQELPHDSFVYLIESFFDCMTPKAKFTQAHVNHVSELAHAISIDTGKRNPNPGDIVVKTDFAYSLQGYFEVMAPTSMSKDFCLKFCESQSENSLEYFPECKQGLTAGIRRGELSGDQLDWMKKEISEYFVHCVDPNLPGDKKALQIIHDGPKAGGLIKSDRSEILYTC
jgi:hypothetical protein